MATSIYCPKCEWQPGPHDRWMCIPGCNTIWNTFETHALCPGCHKQWHVTQCLLCGARSPHDDWYHDHDEDAEGAGEPAEQEEELELVGVE